MGIARVFLASAALLGAGGLAGSATAAEFSTDAGGGALRNGYTQASNYAGSLGTEFTVGGTGLTVNSLGFYDGPDASTSIEGDGLLESHQVGIFDTNGTLLTSATVPAGGGTLVGDFRYVALDAPITLDPNMTYVLAGQVPSTSPTGDTFRDAVEANVNETDLQVVQGRYTGPPANPTYLDGEFEFPNVGTGGAGLVYFGPSLQYTLVPEPAGAGLLGIALLGLLARRRGA